MYSHQNSKILQKRNGQEYSMFEALVTIMYPVLDILLTPLALLIFYKFKGGEFGKSWLIISLGFIIMIAADLVFGIGEYLIWENSYFIYDNLYNISYFLYAIGAYQIHTALKSI